MRAVTFNMKIAKFMQNYAIFALSPYLKLKFRACGGQFWRLAVLAESGPVDLPVAGRKEKKKQYTLLGGPFRLFCIVLS